MLVFLQCVHEELHQRALRLFVQGGVRDRVVQSIKIIESPTHMHKRSHIPCVFRRVC